MYNTLIWTSIFICTVIGILVVMKDYRKKKISRYPVALIGYGISAFILLDAIEGIGSSTKYDQDLTELSSFILLTIAVVILIATGRKYLSKKKTNIIK